MKIDLTKALERAQGGGWALRKLNLMLWTGIPFNKPHRIRVHRVTPDGIEVIIPNRRKNRNHLRGIHACALATGAEFCSGLMMLRLVDARRVRLIMQKIEVRYVYQAKMDAFARFELRRQDIELPEDPSDIGTDSFYHTCEIPVHDADGNHLCTAFTTWQLKPWDRVKTKV